MRLRRKTTFIFILASSALASAIVAACHLWVARTALPFCYSTISNVPEMKTALVLGCAPTVQGRPNLFFTKRISAAASLFQAGRVKALIVSGDNGTHHYDETTAMRDALVKVGVPSNRIFLDYAGFRTLDSIIRAKVIFGQAQFVIVSQQFHNERAVFLARQHGIQAVAYNAADVIGKRALRTHLREYLARVQAVLDTTLLHTQPTFLGDPVKIEPH